MKRTMHKTKATRPLFLLAVTSLLVACGSERAQTLNASGQSLGAEQEGRLALRAVIAVSGNPLAAYDISWVDQTTQTYYLADRSNAGVDFFDARNNTYIRTVTGFVGVDTRGNDFSGPNGILTIPSQRQLWAGDGPGAAMNSSVKVIDLTATPPHIIDTIHTGGTHRCDEMAYDPDDHILAVVNNADEPPFLTLISTQPPRHVLHQFIFNAALGAPFGVTAFSGGLEQPVFNPLTQLFYVSVPELNHDASLGAVAVLNPRTHQMVDLFRVTDCSPAGLALGPHQHLLLGCSDPSRTVVMSARHGRIVREILEVGGSDEVWFNPGDDKFYLAARDNPSGPVLGVIDAETNQFVTSAPTAFNSHSVAVNEHDNHVFVPLTRPRPGHPEDPDPCVAFGGPQFTGRGCIGVYWRSDESEHGDE